MDLVKITDLCPLRFLPLCVQGKETCLVEILSAVMLNFTSCTVVLWKGWDDAPRALGSVFLCNQHSLPQPSTLNVML